MTARLATFSERLEELIVQVEGERNVSAFQRRSGVAESVLRNYLAGRSSPTLEKLIAIAEAGDTTIDWLVGHEPEGDMVRESAAGYEIARVPVFDAYLGAGPGGTGTDLVVGHGTFVDSWLRRRGVNPDDAFIAQVRGRSMQDLLDDGDLVLGVRAVEIDRDDIWALDLNGDLLVKHVHRTGDSITLISEHPSYPAVEVASSDDLRVIGRVVLAITEI